MYPHVQSALSSSLFLQRRLQLFLLLSLSFALTSRAVCLRKGRQWARGSGAMCPRRSRVEYVGSLRSIACARSPTDVTPDPHVLNDRCHCALKRLLPLSALLARCKRYIATGPGGGDGRFTAPRVYGRPMPAFLHHGTEKSGGVWPLMRDKARRASRDLIVARIFHVA